MPDTLTIRNITSVKLTLNIVKRFEAVTSNSWERLKARSLFGSRKDASDEPDESDPIGQDSVNVQIEPFSIQTTRIPIKPKGKDVILRLTFSSDGAGSHRIDVPTSSGHPEAFTPIAGGCSSLVGLYFDQGFLTIFASRNAERWMKGHSDSTPLNALSIPGTHNSPTCHKALPSVRCQAVSTKEQLENGVRFFDLRLQVDNPDDKKSDELTLVHSVFPIALSGSKKFTPLYEEVKQFLKKNPSETVIFSLKREGTGEASDANLAQRLHDHYIDEKHWVMESGVPTLGDARGKIVLFRRYRLNDEMKKLYGKASGINAQGWADNTANNRSGDVQVQDFYQVAESENVATKTKYVCDHCERAAATEMPIDSASSKLTRPSGPLFVNFLSASNFWKRNCWPEKIAAKINPAVLRHLCEKHDTGTIKAQSHGSTGVLVCDWVGGDGDWDLVTAIIGMNEKLLAKDTSGQQSNVTHADGGGQESNTSGDEREASTRGRGRRRGAQKGKGTRGGRRGHENGGG